MEKNESAWKELTQRLQIGQEITGTVFKQEPYGVHVDIGEAFHGIVLAPYISIKDRHGLEEYPKVGDIITSLVLFFDPNYKGDLEFRYISLSIKDYLLKKDGLSS